MTIRIEKKDNNTIYAIFINDEDISGVVLSVSELRQLNSRITEVLQEIESSSQDNN